MKSHIFKVIVFFVDILKPISMVDREHNSTFCKWLKIFHGWCVFSYFFNACSKSDCQRHRMNFMLTLNVCSLKLTSQNSKISFSTKSELFCKYKKIFANVYFSVWRNNSNNLDYPSRKLFFIVLTTLLGKVENRKP